MIRITVRVEDSSGVTTQKIHMIDDIVLTESSHPLHLVCDKIRDTANSVVSVIEDTWGGRSNG